MKQEKSDKLANWYLFRGKPRWTLDSEGSENCHKHRDLIINTTGCSAER